MDRQAEISAGDSEQIPAGNHVVCMSEENEIPYGYWRLTVDLDDPLMDPIT